MGPPLHPVVDHTRWSPSWDWAAGNIVSTAPDLPAGADPGYATVVEHAPRLRLTIVVLANRCCDQPSAGDIFQTVAKTIIQWERGQAGGPRTRPPPAHVVRQWRGPARTGPG